MKKLSPMDCQLILKRNFAPWIQSLNMAFEDVQPGKVRLRLPAQKDVLRSGEVVCAQALTALADTTMVFVVASTLGEFRPVSAVTQTVNFLRPVGAGDVVAEGRMLKSGRSLCFGEIEITMLGNPEPVAHVTATYSLPQAKPI